MTTIIQQVAGEGNLFLPNPVGVGNTLVYVGAARGVGLLVAGALTGWTVGPDGETDDTQNTVAVYYRGPTTGAESQFLLGAPGAAACNGVLYEIPGDCAPNAHDEVLNTGITLASNPITVPAGSFVVGIRAQGWGGGYDSVANLVSYTVGGGWTEDLDQYTTGGHPTVVVAHRLDAGTYSYSTTNDLPSGDPSIIQVVSFSGPVTAPDPGPVVVVYDPDDTLLGDLTDNVRDVKIRIELNGTGWGSFRINRHVAEATAALLKPGNYVRVTIPQIDPNPIFGFFLEGSGAPETPTILLVSTDEEGGEMATFGGRGSLSYWDRAIWLAQSFLVNWWPAYMEAAHGVPPAGTLGMVRFLPGNYARYTTSGNEITSKIPFTTAGGFSAYYDRRKRYFRDIGGTIYWTTLIHLTTAPWTGWYVKPWGSGVFETKASAHYRFGNSVLMESIDDGDKPGQVLYAMYGESQAASRPIHPLPLLTVDFDATNDSDGNPWTTTDALAAVSTELGDDYLSTVGKMTNTGAVDVWMDPDLGMHAYNSYGRDLTASVRFAKGLNFADELGREYSDTPSATFVEVQGQSEGVIARITAAGSPPREVSVHGDSDDVTVLEALGDAELALRLLHSDSVAFNVDTPIIGHEDPANGLFLPGPPGSANGDYWIGDLVTLHTGAEEHDFDEDAVRIAAITLQFTEANDLRATAEVISGFGGIPTLGSPTSSGPTAGGAGIVSTISDLYQLVSEKDQPLGYAGLNDDGRIDMTADPTSWKQSVRAASTADGTIATAYEAGDALDGVTLAEGDYILLKDQSTGADNGIYIVNATGAPTRRPDFDEGQEVFGSVVLAREGTANAGTVWRLSNTTEPVIGTDALTFTEFSGGSALTIKDEGSSLATAATSIDFVGAGVTASGTTAAKTVTISGAPTGTAGGDLSGTYPNPSVVDDSHSHTSATLPAASTREILISDTPSTPLVFADLIQNEAQDDLVYSD